MDMKLEQLWIDMIDIAAPLWRYRTDKERKQAARTTVGFGKSARLQKRLPGGSVRILLAVVIFVSLGGHRTCWATGAGTVDAVYSFSATGFLVDPFRPYVYASCGASLEVINSSTLAVERSVSLPAASYGMAMSPDGSKLFIAGGSSQSVFVLDCQTWGLLPSLSVGDSPTDLAMGLNNRLFVLGSRLSQVDATTGASVGPDAPVYPYSGALRISPDRKTLYYADFGLSPGTLYKLDVSSTTPTLVWHNGVDIGENGEQLALSHDGSMVAYVCGFGYNGYQIPNFRTSDMSLLGVFPTGAYPDCLVYSPDDKYAYALHTIYPTAVDIYDVSNYARVGQFPVVDQANVMTTDQTGQHLFIAFNGVYYGHTEVRVYDTGLTPSITQQPATNTLVIVGGAVYLSVTAAGLPPLAYQWTLFGTNIPGATNYFLSMASVQVAQQGDYYAVVRNAYGAVTSTVAHVSVLLGPSIASQSSNTTVLAGQSVSLSVTPAGSAPFSYRWMFENGNVTGGTTQTLSVNNAQAANEGIYRVVVNNAVGSVTSAPVLVRVLPAAPLIVINPASLAVAASSNATFGVSAIGSQPLTYQWFFQGAPIAGAASSQFALNNVQSSNAGTYKVVVGNSMGSATSAVASLTVTALAPYFTTQPAGAAVSVGSSRTLTGLANGSQPIGYQWQHNSTNLPGAAQTSLVLTNLALTDSGPYTLVASNLAGVSTSAVAQITVYQNPTLVQVLTNQVADINSTVMLAVSALGSPSLVYSWQLNGQPIAGSSPTLSLTNIQPTQSGYYRVTVTNQYGSVSSTGRVSVLGWPSWVTAWGDDSGGQTNVPANLNDAVAVAGGDYHTVALHHDGTLIAWGYNGDGQTSVPTNALRFVSVASGAAHGLAITEKGSAVAWGRNEAGQCNVPSASSNSVLAVAGGDAHSLALLSSGSVLGWGDNSFGQSSVPQGLSGVRSIAAGRNHSLALGTNGAVVGWGFNAYGQASAPVLSNAVAIAAGYLHSVALLSNGTVVVWGDNTFGQGNVPASATNVVAIAAGDFHSLALRADGAVVGWGDDSCGQTNVPGRLANVLAIASGNYYGLALTPAMGGLQSSLISARFVVRWSGYGTLQWAATVRGPYTDVGCQGTCYTNLDMNAPARFFRLRQ